MAETSLRCPYCGAPCKGTNKKPPPSCGACSRELLVSRKYRVLRAVAETPSAVIYEAESIHSGERVAVKSIELRRERWDDWELIEQSIRVLQGLEHAGLPKVFAFERSESGRLLLVRELFDEHTLEERIREQRRHLTPAQVRKLLVGLLEI